MYNVLMNVNARAKQAYLDVHRLRYDVNRGLHRNCRFVYVALIDEYLSLACYIIGLKI